MRKPAKLVAVGVALATTAATAATMSANAAVGTDTSALRDAVTVEGVKSHLNAFQAIANANNGTRASGTSGYDDSAGYVKETLDAAGYDVTEQFFDYELFIEHSTPILGDYTAGEDFLTMEYSGRDDVTAKVTPVDLVMPPGAPNSSTSGCESSDFAGFPSGNIALIQRGTCTFRLKVDNAAAAGASGVIIFNEGQPGRESLLNGTLSQPQAAIPAVGTTFAVGQELYDQVGNDSEFTIRLAVDATVETRTTSNVFAETPGGRSDRVVMAGGHLDSVLEGPGINDNGSGSAVLLEIALQMAELGIEPRNKVRFAFWGAEESGLIGSEHYVASLTRQERNKIMLYLNFDMVGSPNFVPFVYDGDGSAFGLKGPSGSSHIEATFADFFEAEYDGSEPTAFSGRSDYAAFIANGIPSGGLFTGAEGVKTQAQADKYGGTAGIAYDACYHRACDDIDNINDDALNMMSDAVAHAVLTYAMTTSSVNGTAKAADQAVAATGMDYAGHTLRQ